MPPLRRLERGLEYISAGPRYTTGYRLFSLRQECSSQWHGFVSEGAPPLSFSLAADRLAFNCTDPALPADSKVSVRAFGGKDPADLDLTLKLTLKIGPNSEPLTLKLDKNGASSGTLKKKTEFKSQADGPEECTIEISTKDRSTLAGLTDIVLVLPFEGTLVWD